MNHFLNFEERESQFSFWDILLKFEAAQHAPMNYAINIISFNLRKKRSQKIIRLIADT